jgi:hypothetical protein
VLKKFNSFLINGDFPAPKKVVTEVIQGEEEEQGKEKEEVEPANNDAPM